MPSNPTPLAESEPVVEPVETREHVHAALTRTSTGNEDLRELESGLDSLQSDAERKHRIDWSRILLPVAALVVLVLIWQFYVSLGVKRRDLVPGPLDVVIPIAQPNAAPMADVIAAISSSAWNVRTPKCL